jgi:hypothetical protein
MRLRLWGQQGLGFGVAAVVCAQEFLDGLACDNEATSEIILAESCRR